MADLMTEAYTYEDLRRKYDDFCVPLIRIKVGGTELVSTMKLSILDLKATLSLEAASMVVFRLGDIYDMESHSFDSAVKNKFTPGSIVEVELGYQSSAQKIFKGFVAMIGAEYGKIPALVVTLMDARRLMMLSGSKQLLYDVKNYSDAVKKIMGNYSKLCSLDIDVTSDELKKPVSQMQNDYLFITRDLIQSGKVDREFFVLGDKAYFRTPRKVTKPIMKIVYGRELYFLKLQEEFQDLKIEVSGYNPVEQEMLTGEKKIEKPAGQKKLLSETSVYTVSDPDADSQEKVKARAEAIAAGKKWSTCSAWGDTVGLPELVPGRYVEVKDLEKDLGNHKYYIKEVIHEINKEHFGTSFKAGGWM